MADGTWSLRCKPCCVRSVNVMDINTAKQRIDSAISQYGPQAAPAIDLVLNDVRSDLGISAFNELVAEFDLELLYNIAPLESDH